MSIAITEEHQSLAETVRDFVAKRDARGAARELLEAADESAPAFWGDLAQLGWLGLHVAEEHGGSGYGLEELVVALHLKYGIDTGIDLSKLYDLCNAVHRASGTEPPAHKPVGGKLCFTHESGIHISGLLKNPECYQPYPPPMMNIS